jgi:hypothetical protein
MSICELLHTTRRVSMRGTADLDRRGVAMSDSSEGNACIFCKQGPVVKRQETIAFHQSTDKGYVFCRVSIPVATCEECGSMTWDEAAEAALEEAVRQAYEKLP